MHGPVRSDVTRPLPGPPEPWAGSDLPAVRSGPPWLMTEMIAAEPAHARRLLVRLDRDESLARLTRAVRSALTAGAPLVVTGCGTSEHAARAVAEILGDLPPDGANASRPVARQAFEVALDPPASGLLLAVSHEGATWATNRAIEAASTAGAGTALITVSERSPGAALADIVVATGELDQSWCHTIAYIAPIVVGAALRARLAGRPLAVDELAGLLEPAPEATATAENLAAALAASSRVLVVGSGTDRIAAAELALKIEEGSWLPSVARDLETLLHGHLAATDAGTGLVLVLADGRLLADRASRAADALSAAAAIGVRAGAILGESASRLIEPALTPAGRIPARVSPDAADPVAGLLGTAVPLQLLAERLARARGRNPDTIRRDDPAYAEAARRAEQHSGG